MKSLKTLIESHNNWEHLFASVRNDYSFEKTKVFSQLGKKLLRVIAKDVDSFKQNAFIKDESLFLFGDGNKAIISEYPKGELIICKITPGRTTRYYRYQEDVVSDFFNFQDPSSRHRYSWRESTQLINSYSSIIKYENLDNWPLDDVLKLILFVKFNLKSENINSFFDSIDSLMEKLLNKAIVNKIRTQNNRSVQFCSNAQKIIAEEALCRYLIKNKKTSLKAHFSSRDDHLDRCKFDFENSITKHFNFHFDGDTSENYLVWLIWGTTDLDRSGAKLAEGIKKILGEEEFSEFKFMTNPDYRRLYFLNGPIEDLPVGLLDPDEKIRLGCKQKLENLNREAI